MGIRSLMTCLGFAAAALVALLVAPAPAHACEPGYCVQGVTPSDGATDVPTDARLWVFYDTTPGSEPEMTLERVDTEETVAISTEIRPGGQSLSEVGAMVAVVTPDAPLEADTTYRLAFAGPDVCGERDSPVEFTTGSSTASAPADFTGGIQISASCVEAPDEVNSCNDQVLFPHVLFRISPVEPSDAAAFAVELDGQPFAVSDDATVEVQMQIEDVEDASCFELQKYNIAGDSTAHPNTACPTLPSAPACQPEGASDAGGGDAGMDAGDTGDTADGGHLRDDGKTDQIGCGCASTGESPPTAGLLFALLLVGYRLRRRA